MENYEEYEKFIDEYCDNHNIKDGHYMDFTDKLKFDELNVKIINLIEEHCETGFREWSNPEFDYYHCDDYYPIFIKFLKQRYLSQLWKQYKISLTPYI
tara:strand:+ start:102 stop:395 length:294 start_codon:yes stop_codon:yes gene_type:complete